MSFVHILDLLVLQSGRSGVRQMPHEVHCEVYDAKSSPFLAMNPRKQTGMGAVF